MVQPLQPQYGRDLQSLDALKARGGRAVRRVDRAITSDDFAVLAERHAGVWQAAAQARVDGFGGGAMRVDLILVPAGGGAVDALVGPLTQSLKAKAVPGVSITARRFIDVPLTVRLSVTLREGYLPSLELESELASLLQSKAGLEHRLLGDELFVSSLVGVVERHPAVLRAALTAKLKVGFDALANGVRSRIGHDGQLQAVIPQWDQCVHVAPDDLSVTLLPYGGAP